MPEVLTYICPFCDSEVRVGQPCAKCRKKEALSNPDKKPWEQDPSCDGLDLPDEDFEYAEFTKKEFGAAPHHRAGLKWYWWILAIAMLIAMFAGSFFIG